MVDENIINEEIANRVLANLVKDTVVGETSRKLFDEKQNQIQTLIRRNMVDAKVSIGMENRDIINNSITWNRFISSGPVVKTNDESFRVLGINGVTVRKDQKELYGVLNQIYNQAHLASAELRNMIVKDYDKVKEQYESEFESVYDTFYESLGNNIGDLTDEMRSFAQQVISNIHTLKENDGHFEITLSNTTLKDNKSIFDKMSADEYAVSNNNVVIKISDKGILKDLYIPLGMANAELGISNLVLNDINMHKEEIVYENPKHLEGQAVTEKEPKKIKIARNDINNLDHKKTAESLDDIHFDEGKDKKINHEDEYEDNYDQKREQINKDSKENHTKPKDRKEQLHNLKVHEKEDGNWSLSRGIYHTGANIIGGVGYHITYMSSSAKEKLINFAISRGFYGFGKKVIKLFDRSGKDQKPEPKKLENKKTDPKKTKDGNPEPKKVEEKKPDPKKTKDENQEPKKSDDKHTNNLINENDSDSKKYRTLLDNVCERLEKTETNKDDLKKALAEYGISEESYKESSSRRQQQRITQYRNEKYTNQFTQDLHEKVQSAIAKNKYEDDMRLKKEMEKLDQMHQELATIKETKLTTSPYLSDELNKLYEVSNSQKGASTQPNPNTLPDNFNDELNQLFNSPVEEKGKSK